LASSGSNDPRRLGLDGLPPSGVQGIIDALQQFCWADLPTSELVGKLPALRESVGRFLAGYLDAALAATGKRTPLNPEGDVQFHPAIKLMENKTSITASSAADAVLRLLRLSPDHLELFLQQPRVKQAYERAARLRQKKK
jgi:hypothetical protein